MSKDTDRDELRARFTVYISQVIIHAKLDYIRKVKQRAQEIYLEDLEIEPYVDFEEQYVKAYSNTQSFEFEEEKLANAFLSLPLMRQRVLEMLFIEELSAIEIAQKMNCSVKYVYDQKYLALQKLRKSWEVKRMTKSEFAEILTRATEGDHTALDRIFELYMPLIDKHSVVGGRFDEDCKQYIMFQIVLQITRFKI